MSKGIIVVDVPKNCMSCKRRVCFDGESYCAATSKYLDDWEYNPSEGKPDWCPIRLAPEKRRNKDAYTFTDLGFVSGWNACIDEILKGADKNV